MSVRQYNIMMRCVLAILLSALFASCKDEQEEAEETYRPSRIKGLTIGFEADQDGFEKPTTRNVVNSVDNISKLYVLSMRTSDNGGSWTQVFRNPTGTSGIDVLTINKNSTTKEWEYSPEESWDKQYNYRFRAFSKYDNNKNNDKGFTYSNFSSGSTILRYDNFTTNNNPKSNEDLLVSETINRLYSEDSDTDPVQLKMKHLLACVDFKFKTKKGNPVTITKMRIRGYSKKGSCVIDKDPVWTQVWNENPKINEGDKKSVALTYDGNNMTEDTNDFIFVHKSSNLEITPRDLYVSNDGNNNYLYSWSSIYKNFYVYLKSEYNEVSTDNTTKWTLDGTKDDGVAYEKNEYKGYLFIPQELEREGVNFNIDFSLKRKDWGKDDGSVKLIEDIELKHRTFAEVEFHFGDDSNPTLTAMVDLTASGKVKEWEAGIRYAYTIGLYEYQATANVTIEDWTNHLYEEELK